MHKPASSILRGSISVTCINYNKTTNGEEGREREEEENIISYHFKIMSNASSICGIHMYISVELRSAAFRGNRFDLMTYDSKLGSKGQGTQRRGGDK